MKSSNQSDLATDGYSLSLRPRATKNITLRLPVRAITSLKAMAASRDMSVEALIKLYVGHGLRQDLARSFADQVLENTATVLKRHLPTEEVSAIVQEIRTATEQAYDKG